MSRQPSSHDDSLASRELERIIEVCDRFEQAWHRGRPLRIEDLEGTVPAPLRQRLFHELVCLELEFRRARGEWPTWNEYRDRFPDRIGALGSVFAAVGSTRPPNPLPAPLPGVDPADRIGTPATQAYSPRAIEPAAEGLEAGPTSNGLDEPIISGAPRARPVSAAFKIPGYQILGELGAGGMGIVYRARNLRLNRIVALKMMHDRGRSDPGLLARFRTEAEAMAMLHGPHIVQIHDFGDVGASPYFVLELLEGGSLADRLRKTTMPSRPAAELLIVLAEAIATAHSAGIVHRDLKPANVLFTAEGMPKIGDFGVAKLLGKSGTQTESGHLLGTPSYMAPEQARGDSSAVGPAADVYALGAILYELLTGRPPFKGPTREATIRQVVDDDPVLPSRIQPGVPRDLETICLKCLAKEPRHRYRSAGALAEDLVCYLEGRPITARRTPPWERLLKWIRRRPAEAALAATALVVAASVMTLVFVFQDHNYREAVRIERLRTAAAARLNHFGGQNASRRHEWFEAREALAIVEAQTRSEPRLAELHRQARQELVRVDQALAQQRARDEAGERYHRFRERRDEAVYHNTQFVGLDPSASRDAARRSAQAALAVFAATAGDESSWRLGPGLDALLPDERREVEEACYTLLLTLAGSDGESELSRSLSRLEQARSLRPDTRAYHLCRAQCLSRSGDRAGAEHALLQAERVPLVTALDYFLVGQNAFERRDWARAVEYLEETLRQQPEHFWAHGLAAVCCLQLGRAREARVHLTACLQREPQLAWLYVLRGYASGQAAVVARRASADRRSSAGEGSWPLEARFEAAEADYATAETLLTRSPNPEIRYLLLVNRGLHRIEQKRWDEAAGDLEAAIRLDGGLFPAHANLAELHQRQGNPDLAVAEYDRALALRPDLAALYRGRAEVTLRRSHPTSEQRTRALRDLDAAIERELRDSPLRARDHARRAEFLLLEGRREEALAAAEAALKIIPHSKEAARWRIEALLSLKRYDGVAASCDVLLSGPEPLLAAYELRSLARERQGDLGGAIEDLTQFLARQPRRAPLLNRRGTLYLLAHALDLAHDDFDEAIRLDPALAEAYCGRGTARALLGRHQEAVADAAVALRLGPPDHNLLYRAARVYALAATAVTSDLKVKGHDVMVLIDRCQDRALELAGAARARLPDEERASFETVLRTDPALAAIQGRLRSARLIGHVP
jgi:tetratricopeptide (TPR) repeat protein